MPIIIREVAPVFPEYEAVWQLRDSVLRKPLGLTLNREEVLGERDQIHLAAFEGEALVGCVLLAPGGDGLRLRQMAVAERARGRGFGRELLIAAEDVGRKQGYSSIWCHAREAVLEFYKSNGWVVEGGRFIEVTLPHFAMRKRL